MFKFFRRDNYRLLCSDPHSGLLPNQVVALGSNSVALTRYVARHGLTTYAYQTLFNSLTSNDFRLIQVTGYVDAGQDHFAVLFERSSGPPQICHHGLTRDGYQQAFDTATAQGFKPVLVNGYTSASGIEKYVAIFEKPMSTPEWLVKYGMTWVTCQDEFDKWTSKGYKPTHISVYAVGSVALYAFIWEKSPSPPTWIARYGMTSAQCQAEFNTHGANGYVPTLVSGYAVNNVDYYAAIWEKKPSVPWIVKYGLTGQAYQGEFTNQYYQGYRLKMISGYTVNNTSLFAAIWENSFISGADLDKINNPINAFMSKYSIPGLSLAITRDDRLVFAKGFGLADTSTREQVHPDHLFRIASVSKPMTSLTIMKLIEQGRFSLAGKVFGPGALLGTTYGIMHYSQWTLNITVQHLLDHTSGYSNTGGDPMFMNLGMTQSQLITWMLDTRQPASAPGTTYEYLNFGYCLLGRIIEKVTGQPYETYVMNNILNSAPQSPNKMVIGRDTPAERAPNEVTYYPSSAYSLKLRRLDALGGWIARPIDLAGVLTCADGFSQKPDIISSDTLRTMWKGSTANSGYGKGWNIARTWRGHNGYMNGTASYLVRRRDGFGFAVTVNTNPADDSFTAELKKGIDGLIDKVRAWPLYDLF